MATWNAAFNASPAGGDNPSQGDDKIREFKVTMYDRWVKEHYLDLSEGGAQPRQGLHRAGSAVAFYQVSAPTQRNGVALGSTDSGIIWINSTTKDMYTWTGSAWALTAMPPIGSVYMQLPGYDAPGTLYPGTTWTDISSVFAGDFFRVAGGNASAFASGRQAQDIQPHGHFVPVCDANVTGAIYPRLASGGTVYPVSVSTALAGATETRPQNQTILVFVRTA
jgi:hypothetical protein